MKIFPGIRRFVHRIVLLNSLTSFEKQSNNYSRYSVNFLKNDQLDFLHHRHNQLLPTCRRSVFIGALRFENLASEAKFNSAENVGLVIF